MNFGMKLLAGVVILVVVGFGLLVGWSKLGTARQKRLSSDRLAPVARALTAGQEPAAAEIARLAADPLTRNALTDLLDSTGHGGLLPPPYRSLDSVAAADMTVWLMHPNELDAAPNYLEATARVARDGGRDVGEVVWVVFRFRMDPPHWAAKDGWLAGVAGPYKLDGDRVVGRASATWSDFTPYDSLTPDQHVDLLHVKAVESGTLKEWSGTTPRGAV